MGKAWLSAVKRAFRSPTKENGKRNSRRREEREHEEEEEKVCFTFYSNLRQYPSGFSFHFLFSL